VKFLPLSAPIDHGQRLVAKTVLRLFYRRFLDNKESNSVYSIFDWQDTEILHHCVCCS
jgi:hypothetical protein